MNLRNMTLYSIFVRNFGGTFAGVARDIPRIRALGADAVWLLPIHPTGRVRRKGSLGSPYAIADYRAVNPEFGTLEDFRRLADTVHENGMKLMIDVVYNHTSPDAVLFQTHPEFYYRDAEGRTGNKFGDWADVIDLDYSVKELWDYQIESLRFWAGIVDGFRCDVASLVPLDFWRSARAAVREVDPDHIWLAESVHRSFAALARRRGFRCARDTEAYDAFDLEYDYDIREVFDKLLRRQAPLSQWIDLLEFQEAVYPANYNKMRCLENHDQPRIASVIRDEEALINYTALLYFLKGTVLLYAGQEFEDPHQPSLFEREPIDRHTGKDLSPLLSKLAAIRKANFTGTDSFWGQGEDEKRIAVLRRGGCAGVFCLDAAPGAVSLEERLELPDGCYENLLGGESVRVEKGVLFASGKPAIFRLT